jgi:hypothetical protein
VDVATAVEVVTGALEPAVVDVAEVRLAEKDETVDAADVVETLPAEEPDTEPFELLELAVDVTAGVVTVDASDAAVAEFDDEIDAEEPAETEVDRVVVLVVARDAFRHELQQLTSML